VEALRAAGLKMSVEEGAAARKSDALAGKTIVISGNFSISRDDMKALIEANGGRNSGSVSGKTDYLLAGTKPGPEKLKKAADLGIAVIDEETFMSLISEGNRFSYAEKKADAPENLFPPETPKDNLVEPTLF
jgi:DNA ligase (NAD+)